MIDDYLWLFIDDAADERASFLDQLRTVAAQHSLALRFEAPEFGGLDDTLRLIAAAHPAGAILDIDLSEPSRRVGDAQRVPRLWTGLGLASEIRARQKATLGGQSALQLREFPVVCLSNAQPLGGFLGGNGYRDPSSVDLFEMILDKSDVTSGASAYVLQLVALSDVYGHLTSGRSLDALFGLGSELLSSWLTEGVIERLREALPQAVHVAAGVFVRSLLQQPGPLIDETVLSVRTGIDSSIEPIEWQRFLVSIGETRYSGVGSAGFRRWWARGLESFWDSKTAASASLSRTPHGERAAIWSAALNLRLTPIRSDPASPGQHYWRTCSLIPGRPVDAVLGIRLVSPAGHEDWLDPQVASFGAAEEQRDDPRIEQESLRSVRRLVC